jgi:kinesin family protein 18/19
VKISYIEIYNEQVRDLLSESMTNLMIIEDPVKGISVPDLKEIEVTNIKQLKELLLLGNSKRAMASTYSNQFSSRSHAIFQIAFENRINDKQILYSKLSLIDLAGSERGTLNEGKGQRQLEGTKINQSLLALGNCINILSDKTKNGAYVPYRDSKLTRLLKDSLGGNTKTLMIACVSPSAHAYVETINTLKYAERAKKIKQKATKNIKYIEGSNYQQIIESLKTEIVGLKEQLKSVQSQTSIGSFNENPFLTQRSMGQTRSTLVHANTCSLVKTGLHEIAEIDQQLVKMQEEKELIKKEITQSNKRITENLRISQFTEKDNNYVEKISHDLLQNFEENWEIKQSLNELECLKTQNTETLEKLKAQLNSKNKTQETKVRTELTNLHLTMESNSRIQDEMKSLLETNLNEKKKLHVMLMKVQTTKRKDILELQISTRQLKAEKIDLQIQNLEFKKQALVVTKEKDEKDSEIVKMKEQLEKILTKYNNTQNELRASKTIISRQTRELEELKLSRKTFASNAPTQTCRTKAPISLKSSIDNKENEETLTLENLPKFKGSKKDSFDMSSLSINYNENDSLSDINEIFPKPKVIASYCNTKSELDNAFKPQSAASKSHRDIDAIKKVSADDHTASQRLPCMFIKPQMR